MKRISLISNSSIQYYKFEAEINLDFAKSNKIYYHEPFDNKNSRFIYDPLLKHNIDGEEIFVIKQELFEKKILVTNRLSDEEHTYTRYA